MKNRIDKNGYYLIGEIGVNYYDIAQKNNLSLLDAAKLMCLEGKEAGLDAVKFQSYKAETLASKNSPAYWDVTEETTLSQYELFKKYDFFSNIEYQKLSDYCREIEIEFFSTPFDFESADYLDGMMNYYKISSSDLNNIPFIEYIAKKNKPILLSTGASTLKEIDEAINTVRMYNRKLLILMHCVLEYPTPAKNASLNRILSLKKYYPDLIIGYSDHVKPDCGYTILQTALCLGAVVIEKHFTLDKSLSGNDHYHAMDKSDIIEIRKKLDYQRLIRGSYEIDFKENEEQSRKYARRSIVTTCRIPKGTELTSEHFTFKRPGIGIAPIDAGKIIGKKVVQDIEEDHIFLWNDFE